MFRPFVWVWMVADRRYWRYQVKTVPTDTTLIVSDQRFVGRVLYLAHVAGRADLRVLTQVQVNELVNLWKLKLWVTKRITVVGEGVEVPEKAVAARRLVAPPSPGGETQPRSFSRRPAWLPYQRRRTQVAAPAAISREPRKLTPGPVRGPVHATAR